MVIAPIWQDVGVLSRLFCYFLAQLVFFAFGFQNADGLAQYKQEIVSFFIRLHKTLSNCNCLHVGRKFVSVNDSPTGIF